MELANSTTRGPLPCPESRSLPIYPTRTPLGEGPSRVRGRLLQRRGIPVGLVTNPLVPFIGQDG